METEKSSKYETYEQKVLSLYNSIEEIKENNNKKFNDVKEQVLLIQKTFRKFTSNQKTNYEDYKEISIH